MAPDASSFRVGFCLRVPVKALARPRQQQVLSGSDLWQISGVSPTEDRITMITRNRKTSFLFGGNAPYVEEQYETYLADPTTVSEDWRGYFDALQDVPAVDGSDTGDVAHGPVVSRFVELAKQTRTAGRSENDVLSFARKQVAVQALISAYRMVGTRNAHLDPLRWTALDCAGLRWTALDCAGARA
jgi:hypothetical protein